jgi:hypothetical protein
MICTIDYKHTEYRRFTCIAISSEDAMQKWERGNGHDEFICTGDDAVVLEIDTQEEAVVEQDEDTWPVEDWRYEIANGDTLLGYADWVEHQKEMDREFGGPPDDSWIQSTLERQAGPPRFTQQK